MSGAEEPRTSAVAVNDMQVTVDEDLCIGCGLCEERAPENLEVALDAPSARVVKQPVGSDEVEACTQAVDYCPTGGLQANSANGDAA